MPFANGEGLLREFEIWEVLNVIIIDLIWRALRRVLLPDVDYLNSVTLKFPEFRLVSQIWRNGLLQKAQLL